MPSVAPPPGSRPGCPAALAALALVALLGACAAGNPRPDAPPGWTTHPVAPGETLSQIAYRYQVPMDLLMRANRIEDPDRIRAGARLRIPQRPPESRPEVGSGPPRPGAPTRLDRAEALRAEAEQELRAARYEQVLVTVDRGLLLLDGTVPTPEVRRSQAALDVVGATAEVALGDATAAEARLARALRRQPDLELDPAATSPKVMRLFRDVQAERSGSSRPQARLLLD